MSNERVIESWSSSEYARSWQQADGLSGMLQFPWEIATILIGREASPELVVDVGSGPGTFLERVLQAYPDSRGVWVDASPGMREQAEERLARFGGRVEFVVADAAKLADVEVAHGADVVLNSRVAHHFDQDGLTAFYSGAATVLRSGGWLVTLDHILPPGDWDRRYRDILPNFAGSNAGKPTHPHYFPFPTLEGQFAAFEAAGFEDRDLAWRAFYTCLFVGRKTRG